MTSYLEWRLFPGGDVIVEYVKVEVIALRPRPR